MVNLDYEERGIMNDYPGYKTAMPVRLHASFTQATVKTGEQDSMVQ